MSINADKVSIRPNPQTSLYSSALAVRRSPQSLAAGNIVAAGANAQDAAEPYLTSLAKLFPAEALSALLLVLAIDARYEPLRHTLVGIIAVASGLLRYFSSRNPQTGRSDILGVLVSIVSFLIYAAAMLAFGDFGTDETTTRLVATVAAILWMAILTAVVRKAPVQ